jgi:hypothetical protein
MRTAVVTANAACGLIPEANARRIVDPAVVWAAGAPTETIAG